jgi:hypothetical protein
MISSKAASDVWPTGEAATMPALANTISSLPNLSTASATARFDGFDVRHVRLNGQKATPKFRRIQMEMPVDLSIQ